MSYHKDKECNSAIIRLLDALCMWERNTGRRSTFILIPHNSDENVVAAQDGKPTNYDYRILYRLALKEREEAGKSNLP